MKERLDAMVATENDPVILSLVASNSIPLGLIPSLVKLDKPGLKRIGRSVFDFSVSVPLPARLEGLGPLNKKQKQNQKQI